MELNTNDVGVQKQGIYMPKRPLLRSKAVRITKTSRQVDFKAWSQDESDL